MYFLLNEQFNCQLISHSALQQMANEIYNDARLHFNKTESGMLKDRKINTEQISLCAFCSKKAQRAITNTEAANRWWVLLCVVTHLLMNSHFVLLSFVCLFTATEFFTVGFQSNLTAREWLHF